MKNPKRLIMPALALLLNLTALESKSAVVWSVENRFPLFRNAVEFNSVSAVLQSRTEVKSGGLRAGIQDFNIKFPESKNTAWMADKEQYDKDQLFNKYHKTVFHLMQKDLHGDCTWVLNNKESKTTACALPIEFIIEEKMPFSIVVKRDNIVLDQLNEQVGIAKKIIIGIGDSFASGEGNPDRPTVLKNLKTHNDAWFLDTPTEVIAESAQWWDQRCHRSLHSWQSIYALKQAISNPHRVVIFASFSCSGAEIYDGFFRAQLNPPGDFNVERSHLKYSQQEALSNLLCQEGKTQKDHQEGHDVVHGPAGNQLFGEYKISTCSSPSQADEILFSLGGNDVGFSSVVKWSIFGRTVRFDLLYFPRIFGNFLVNRFFSGSRSPEVAGRSIKNINLLYEDFSKSIDKFIKPDGKIIALLYPDPLPVDDFNGCRLRGRDGNAPFSITTDRVMPLSRYKFGILEDDVKEIREKFISPLRAAQIRAINNAEKFTQATPWIVLDGNEGLKVSQVNNRSVCSTSPTCTKERCEIPNRLTWAQSKHYSEIPRLVHLQEYSPYDGRTARGFRYASDSMLTQAGTTGNMLNGDWIFGFSHPTATVHAALADELFDMKTTTAPPTVSLEPGQR